MTNYLLCCDWGTSSFRLRLIDSTNYQLVDEVVSRQGIANLFDAWKKNGEHDGVSRDGFFRKELKKQIDTLAHQVSIPLDTVPIVVSGMASSSIGMAEIPYATLPFSIDGTGASVRHFDAREAFPHELLLISGVKSPEDVMRGEETQLIGLAALLDQKGERPSDAIFIFPGTHSKHMYVQGGQLVNFETYMTGEVFNLMASQSILKDSVDLSNLTDLSGNTLSAFQAGISAASAPLLNRLFTVRTNQLFEKRKKRENAYYLSGLLIGAELKTLQEKESWKLVLCSGTNLFPFYEKAIETLQLADRTTTIPADVIDKAAIVGQTILFHNLNLKV